MDKKVYVEEHRKLIKLLDQAGKEGKAQKKELIAELKGGMKHDKKTEEKIEKYLSEMKKAWAKLHEGHDDIPDDSLVNLVQSELNDSNLHLPDDIILTLQKFINKHFDNDDVEKKLKFIIRFMFNHNKKEVSIFPKTWKKIYEKLGLTVQKVPNEDPNSIMNIPGQTPPLVAPWSYIPKFYNEMDDYNNEQKNKDKKIVIGIGKPSDGDLHAIIIKKKGYNKNDAVVEAVKFKTSKGLFMRETKLSYRFRNIPKTKFEPKSFRSKKINKNITLVYGKLK